MQTSEQHKNIEIFLNKKDKGKSIHIIMDEFNDVLYEIAKKCNAILLKKCSFSINWESGYYHGVITI